MKLISLFCLREADTFGHVGRRQPRRDPKEVDPRLGRDPSSYQDKWKGQEYTGHLYQPMGQKHDLNRTPGPRYDNAQFVIFYIDDSGTVEYDPNGFENMLQRLKISSTTQNDAIMGKRSSIQKVIDAYGLKGRISTTGKATRKKKITGWGSV